MSSMELQKQKNQQIEKINLKTKNKSFSFSHRAFGKDKYGER